MKWALGIGIAFLILWFVGPAIFRAMVKHDYEAVYYGMQDARRNAGAYVADDEDKRSKFSYSERYIRGLEK